MSLPKPVSSRRTPLAAALCALLFVAGSEAKIAPARARDATALSGSSAVVANCNDSGPGSLRDAVAQADSGDIVDLRGLSCSTITLTTGAITVGVDDLGLVATGQIVSSNSARADGAPQGFDAPTLTIDGGGASRIFEHAGSGNLYLRGLVAENGYADGDGGCIRSAGTVVLVGSRAAHCRAHDADYLHGKGGAVYAAGACFAYYSAIVDNRAEGKMPRGGGIFANSAVVSSFSTIADNAASGYLPTAGGVFSGATAIVELSTLSGNTALTDRSGGAGQAGAAYVRDNLLLYYSTVSGNRADDIGGVFSVGVDRMPSTIVESTVSGNQGARIGGLLASYTPLQILNSTIANNTATQDGGTGGLVIGADVRIVSSIVAANLAGAAASDIGRRDHAPASTVITGDHDLIGASAIATPADTIAQPPRLAPLADNGGPTRTHALLPDSPAIDHGSNPLSLPCDQRHEEGYARSVGVGPDIGAFEFSAADRIFADGFQNDSESCSHA